MIRPSRTLPSKLKGNASEFAKSVQDLERQLKAAVATNSSLNLLVDLLDLTCNAEDPQDTSKGINALHGIFVSIIAKGNLSIKNTDDSKIVRAWIWDRLNSYADFLTSLLADREKTLQVRLGIYKRCVRFELISWTDIYPADLVLAAKASLSLAHQICNTESFPVSHSHLQENCFRPSDLPSIQTSFVPHSR
jgi:hypothetical protein